MRAEELISLATDQSQPMTLALGQVLHGWSTAALGKAEAGSRELRQGIAAYPATGAELWLPYFLALLADAVEHAGQPAERLDLLTQALKRVTRTGECWFEAELHRLRGEYLLAIVPVSLRRPNFVFSTPLLLRGSRARRHGSCVPRRA